MGNEILAPEYWDIRLFRMQSLATLPASCLHSPSILCSCFLPDQSLECSLLVILFPLSAWRAFTKPTTLGLHTISLKKTYRLSKYS